MFSYCECEYVNLFSIDQICVGHTIYLPPANEVCEGYVFTPVCQSFCSQGGGVCVVAGGHAWLPGGMHGCGGVCMVLGGCMVAGGHAWLRGCAWLQGCVWLSGGMCGCEGHVLLWGHALVAGGCAWLWGGHVWWQDGCAWDTTRYSQ